MYYFVVDIGVIKYWEIYSQGGLIIMFGVKDKVFCYLFLVLVFYDQIVSNIFIKVRIIFILENIFVFNCQSKNV